MNHEEFLAEVESLFAKKSHFLTDEFRTLFINRLMREMHDHREEWFNEHDYEELTMRLKRERGEMKH